MTDKKQKPVRMNDNSPPMVVDGKPPKNWLSNKIDEINYDAASKTAAAANRLAAQHVQATNLGKQFQDGSVEYQKAVLRNTPENIEREAQLERGKTEAEFEETTTRVERAKAETKQIVGDFEARAAIANASKLEADLKAKGLQRKIDALDNLDPEEERKKLLAAKAKLETEIAAAIAEIKKLLLDDEDEEAEGNRRILEAKVAELKRGMAEIDQKIRELDGE